MSSYKRVQAPKRTISQEHKRLSAFIIPTAVYHVQFLDICYIYMYAQYK